MGLFDSVDTESHINVVLCGRPARTVDVARLWRPVRTSYESDHLASRYAYPKSIGGAVTDMYTKGSLSVFSNP